MLTLRKRIIVFHIIIIAVIIGAMAFFDIVLDDCPIRAVLGIPCPACGMTRSLTAFVSLDFAASFNYHPLTLPCCAVIWFAFHRNLFKISENKKNAVIIIFAVIIFIVYLIRLIWGRIP